jgi:hypothetical protein
LTRKRRSTAQRDVSLRREPERDESSGKQVAGVRRKIVAFDGETFHALQVLARDRFATFQELADEAFADLLAKHHRPVTLRDALKKSAARPRTVDADSK